jgi:hypothetical protein
MTKRIIISLAQENQAVEENEITGAAIDQTEGITISPVVL